MKNAVWEEISRGHPIQPPTQSKAIFDVILGSSGSCPVKSAIKTEISQPLWEVGACLTNFS